MQRGAIYELKEKLAHYGKTNFKKLLAYVQSKNVTRECVKTFDKDEDDFAVTEDDRAKHSPL